MRVIAGSARGIKLETLEGLDTRPTTDRVKEAVFSMIHPNIGGAVCLDLFSGSGSLGIELLSRGAKSVTFVEGNHQLKSIIISNLNKTKLMDQATLLFQDVYRSIEMLSGKKFDLILMDPPYLKGDIRKTLDLIAKYNLLNENGLVIAEHDILDTDILPCSAYFESLKTKKYGKIGVTVFRRLL